MRTIKQIISDIEKQKTIISKARDELREIEGELGDLLDSSDRGIVDLQSAVDALSKYM